MTFKCGKCGNEADLALAFSLRKEAKTKLSDINLMLEKLINYDRYLSERHKAVLTLYFGLFGEHALFEIGEKLGITREKARQTLIRAIAKLGSCRAWKYKNLESYIGDALRT